VNLVAVLEKAVPGFVALGKFAVYVVAVNAVSQVAVAQNAPICMFAQAVVVVHGIVEYSPALSPVSVGR